MQHINMYPASVYASTQDAEFISQVYWSPNLHDFEILHYPYRPWGSSIQYAVFPQDFPKFPQDFPKI